MSTTCKRLTTKRYRERPSPPYSANVIGCRGKRRKGNDGRMYVSVPNKNDIYRWVAKQPLASRRVPRRIVRKRVSGRKVASGGRKGKALELRQWIALAEKRGLTLTADAARKHPIGTKFDVTPLEYTKFVYHEYPKRTIKKGRVYAPETFFKPMRHALERLSDPKVEQVERITGKHKEPTVEFRFYSHNTKDKAYEGSLSVEKGYPSLTGGSGDGFTSYMAWNKLAKMPHVYNGPNYR